MGKKNNKTPNYFDRALIRLHRQYGKDELVLALKTEISQKNIEIGQLKSYIDEIMDNNNKLKALKDNIDPEIKAKVKKDELVRGYKNQLNNVNSKLSACKKDREQLIIKLNEKSRESDKYDHL